MNYDVIVSNITWVDVRIGVHMKRALHGLLAGVFILLGIIGLIIPVMPQIPFFVAGVFFLCMYSPRFKRLLKKSLIYQRYMKKHVDANDKFKEFMDRED